MSVSFIPNPWHEVIINAGQQIGNAIGEANSSGTRVNRPETDWYLNSYWSPRHFWSQLPDPGSSLNSGLRDLLGVNDPTNSEPWPSTDPEPDPKSPGYTPAYNGAGAGSSTAKELEYYYADLARLYGMNRETAYAEAMANTSYQRAVMDMQNAGLNPAVLFSASKASSAGSGHVSGSSSGGGFSSGKGASDGDMVPGWMYYGISALAQIAGTAITGNASGGAIFQNVAQSLMKAYNGR